MIDAIDRSGCRPDWESTTHFILGSLPLSRFLFYLRSNTYLRICELLLTFVALSGFKRSNVEHQAIVVAT